MPPVQLKQKPIRIDQFDDLLGGKGHGNRILGPSDLSDSGSDTIENTDSSDANSDLDTDSAGTGERSSEGNQSILDADIGIDRIVDANEAGLGGGLDQAEEARLGVNVNAAKRRAKTTELLKYGRRRKNIKR